MVPRFVRESDRSSEYRPDIGRARAADTLHKAGMSGTKSTRVALVESTRCGGQPIAANQPRCGWCESTPVRLVRINPGAVETTPVRLINPGAVRSGR